MNKQTNATLFHPGYFAHKFVSTGFAGLLLWCGLGCDAGDQDDQGDQDEQGDLVTIAMVTNNANGLRNIEGFYDEMTALGYVEGENATFVFAGEPVSGAALDAYLEQLVDEDVDLIFTAGTPTGVAAYQATQGTDIPVVFGVIADPVAAGVMDDVTMPGGNITGVMLSSNQVERMEQLIEMAPDIERVHIIYNPEDAAPTSALAQLDGVADELGIELVTREASTDAEVSDALADVPEDIDAIFLLPDSVVNKRLGDIVELALARMLPVSGPSIAQVEGGALTAYGIIHAEAGAQAAGIAHQVLQGADPGQIPVQTAESFLAINLITAAAIGVDISEDLLDQAAVIIE